MSNLGFRGDSRMDNCGGFGSGGRATWCRFSFLGRLFSFLGRRRCIRQDTTFGSCSLGASQCRHGLVVCGVGGFKLYKMPASNSAEITLLWQKWPEQTVLQLIYAPKVIDPISTHTFTNRTANSWNWFLTEKRELAMLEIVDQSSSWKHLQNFSLITNNLWYTSVSCPAESHSAAWINLFGKNTLTQHSSTKVKVQVADQQTSRDNAGRPTTHTSYFIAIQTRRDWKKSWKFSWFS